MNFATSLWFWIAAILVFFGNSDQAIDTYYSLTKPFLRSSIRNIARCQDVEYIKESEDQTLAIAKFMEEIPLSLVGPVDKPLAIFLRFAILNDDGKPTNFFRQGYWLTLIFEAKVLEDLENLSPGIVLRDQRGTFLHSKYEHQTDLKGLRSCRAGDRLRTIYSVRLDIAPGQYTFSLEMVSIPSEIIQDGKLSHADYQNHFCWACSTGKKRDFWALI